jgi:hypothetical protein
MWISYCEKNFYQKNVNKSERKNFLKNSCRAVMLFYQIILLFLANFRKCFYLSLTTKNKNV